MTAATTVGESTSGLAGRRRLVALPSGGALYLTHTVLNGRYTLRICIGQTWTEARHVEAAWQRIQETAKLLAAGN